MAKVRRRDGSHLFLTGATRSGKTAAAFHSAGQADRLLVWDPQADWVRFGCAPVGSLAALARLLREHYSTPARIAAQLPRPQFGAFCDLAFRWGRIEPAVIVVEELAWVTTPGKAPEGWHELVTGGLKFGIDLVSITQRPAESDKTALSQSTVIRCFRQDRFDDAKYMAKELRVDQADIDALADLEYIEKNKRTRELSTGRVTFG